MDYQTGLCFVTLLIIFSIPVSTGTYSVNLDRHSFDEAEQLCASDGSLTNMPDPEETKKIVKLIEDKQDRNSTSFWIGLKKHKTQCVERNLPLKGFHWTVDNSTTSEFDKWKEEPHATCTGVLCGLLSVEYKDSKIDSWGLTAKTCSKKFPFICKHKGSITKIACSLPPQILGDLDIVKKDKDPYTLWVSCSGTHSFILSCSRSAGEWKLVGDPERDIQGLCLECEKGYKKDKDGQCVDIDECKQPNKCKFNCINTQGSYQCTCDKDNFNPEDSEMCKKLKTPIFMPTTDTTNTNKVQDAPTASFMDKISPPTSQTTIEDSSGDFSNIVIPLIIALLIFVVLVVIVVAIVKYFCMRSAKKRAKKQAAAMKELVALNGSDSMEKVNE